jgi:hypothetical protein
MTGIFFKFPKNFGSSFQDMILIFSYTAKTGQLQFGHNRFVGQMNVFTGPEKKLLRV